MMHKIGRAVSLFVLAALILGSTFSRAGDTGEVKLPKGPPDWKVEILAKPPELNYPSVVCSAPDGRIFVAEDPMDMPGPANKPIDRVLCIHPDGKITVFADGLYSVFGLLYIDGKVYVHHCPKLSVYRDENGVGKDRVDLIDTTNPEPWGGTNLNDHIPSNIRLAMDGYIYMSTGDKGIFGATSNADKRKAELHGGGILRIRPDGTDMEIYCSGTRNHLDVSINAEDEMFTYDNTDDGHGWWCRFSHMVDGGYYGYPFEYRPLASDLEGMAKYRAEKGSKPYAPYTLWRIDEYGGGSPVGSVAYNEDALPEEYHGNLFHCEWGKGQLERFVVSRDGGTFKIDKREPFLTKGNAGDLRPLGVNVLPDGTGLLIADWNYGGWKKNQPAGRLIKMTYTGKMTPATKPEWYIPAAMGQKFNATTQDLIAGLSHPSQYVRLVAQRRLAERGAEVVAPLVAVLKDEKAPEFARWSAIWTLDKLENGAAGRDTILAVLRDEKAPMSVRLQAARQLGTRGATQATSSLIALLDHSDAAMRFRAATALGRIGDVSAVQPLIDHLTEKDFFAHFALFTALNRIGRTNSAAWETLAKALNSDKPEIRDGCTYAMRETYDEALIKALSGVLGQAAAAPEARAAAIRAIAPLFKMTKPWNGHWWGTQPFAGPRPAHEVDWAGTAPAVTAIKSGLKDSNAAVRMAALQALQVAPDPTAGPTLVELFKNENDVGIRTAILRAMASSKAEEATALVAGILKDPIGNKDLLGDALNVAKQSSTPEMSDVLTNVAAADVAPDVLILTIETMAKIHDVKAAPILIKRLSHTDGKVAEAAANALGYIKTDDSIAALIAALKDKRAEVRRAAAGGLEKLKPVSAVEPLLACRKGHEMDREVLQALTNIPDVRALDAYLEGLDGRDGGLKDRCRKAISTIHEAALPLIEAKLDKKPFSTQVTDELQRVYRPLIPKGQDGGKLFKVDTKNLSPDAFGAFAMSHKGDAENGKKLFFANGGVGCYKCHKVGNDGAEIGPSLSGVGVKYDREKLIESVVYPSKVILDGYQQSTIKVKDGQVYTGIIRGETDNELTVIDVNGQKTEIKKADIKVRKVSEISLMPEGLFTSLKPEEFADLISYLESLKEKPDAAKK